MAPLFTSHFASRTIILVLEPQENTMMASWKIANMKTT